MFINRQQRLQSLLIQFNRPLIFIYFRIQYKSRYEVSLRVIYLLKHFSLQFTTALNRQILSRILLNKIKLSQY